MSHDQYTGGNLVGARKTVSNTQEVYCSRGGGEGRSIRPGGNDSFIFITNAYPTRIQTHTIVMDAVVIKKSE